MWCELYPSQGELVFSSYRTPLKRTNTQLLKFGLSLHIDNIWLLEHKYLHYGNLFFHYIKLKSDDYFCKVLHIIIICHSSLVVVLQSDPQEFPVCKIGLWKLQLISLDKFHQSARHAQSAVHTCCTLPTPFTAYYAKWNVASSFPHSSRLIHQAPPSWLPLSSLSGTRLCANVKYAELT